ncbi:hypothetical protein [Paraburkholderia sp.]|uniref:hypothetical protein n=1 Tax=Paraburkholderia sp. TaxID=1926495 RepID=UPI00286F07F1|nr:hypothetical protein [Paraburkholderia sp.]
MLPKIQFYANRLRDRLLPRVAELELDTDSSVFTPALLFSLTIVFYVVYMLCMQSAFVLGGEMWAEMATNYFANANGATLAQKLLSTDAGYIPLPQRLIGFVFSELRLPASAIPFAYTWTAIFGTAAMIGAFCLRPFRAVVKSDGLRFVSAIAVLMVVDFESRTFINFTYLAAFLVAVVTALALVDKTRDVPQWCWVLPILMLSKPAVLAALPVMLLTAFVSAPRFRKIVVVVVLLCAAQAVQIVVSHAGGTFAAAHSVSLGERLVASARYFVGFLGAYVGGTHVPVNLFHPMRLGAILLLGVLLLILRRKAASNALLVVGLALLLFNVLLNCFALPDMWNTRMERLAGQPVYRHIIVGFEGVLLCVVALCDRFFPRATLNLGIGRLRICILLFVCWFAGAGWFSRGTTLSVLPGTPALNNSAWRAMARTVDAGGAVCVPVDPIGWVFGRDCGLLNSDEVGPTHTYDFGPMLFKDAASVADVPVPKRSEHHVVSALAVLAKPANGQVTHVPMTAVLTMVDGTQRILSGDRRLPSGGGLVLLTPTAEIALEDIRDVRIESTALLQFGFVSDSSPKTPAVLWMGR